MAAACRRMAVDPKLLEQSDYDLPLDPNFDLGVGDWLRILSEEDEENPGRAKSADLPKKQKLSLSLKKKRQPLKEVGSNSGRFASPYEPLVERSTTESPPALSTACSSTAEIPSVALSKACSSTGMPPVVPSTQLPQQQIPTKMAFSGLNNCTFNFYKM